MNDGLRIDMALARAAGLPLRSANQATTPLPPSPSTPQAGDAPAFSPLALLLARVPSPPGAPAPTLTLAPDEVRLLHATLQQRVVAVLRDAGLDVPTALRVAIDDDGALRLAPPPVDAARVTQVLAQAPDVARLAHLVHAATFSTTDVARDTDVAEAASMRAPAATASDERRIRAWPFAWSTSDEGQGTPRGLPAPALLFLVAGLAWVAWRLFG